MTRPLRIAILAALAILALVGAGSGAASATAPADQYAGPDPTFNYAVGSLPDACNSPTSAGCINAAVAYLDQARAKLGQPPYQMPSNFDSLTPIEQGFVLANLDRIQYGLAPITGLTAALNQDAAAGMTSDSDPQPTATNFLSWTSNWAGGTLNMPLAYGDWMYNDGPGSDNLDCTPSNSSGCWGHRHDVLWKFDTSGPLAMGASAGTDAGGGRSFTMLLFGGDPTYHPSYTYTWSQAVAAGARSGPGPESTLHGRPAVRRGVATKPGSVHSRVRLQIIQLRARGRVIMLSILAPGARALRCSLTRYVRLGWARDKFRPCPASATLSVNRAGRYRLRVSGNGTSATRYLLVH